MPPPSLGLRPRNNADHAGPAPHGGLDGCVSTQLDATSVTEDYATNVTFSLQACRRQIVALNPPIVTVRLRLTRLRPRGRRLRSGVSACGPGPAPAVPGQRLRPLGQLAPVGWNLGGRADAHRGIGAQPSIARDTGTSRGSPSVPVQRGSGATLARLLGRVERARVARAPWPLLAVLAVQAAASLYLWAGHLEIAHWLHGTPIPAFPAFLSGSPALYPPLGAIADSLGGLAAARILSLGFMLTATALLWGTVTRLYGRRAAFFACALFAVLGPAIRLGAFATYDAMSLCLLALAGWCAVRAGAHQKSSGWLVGTAVALALANGTKYASALFDPVVAGLVLFTGLRMLSRKQALTRAATMLGYTAGIVVFLFAFGGREYWTSVTQSTTARVNSTDPVSSVISASWHLTGIIVALAAAGAVLSLVAEPGWHDRLLVWLAAGAAVLVPLAQARIHTLTSLDKHVVFGTWFAAIAAGYAVDRLVRWASPRPVRWTATAVCLLLLAIPVRIGITPSQALFRTWPNSAALVTALSRVVPRTNGPVLAEHPSLPEYYLAAGTQWARWSGTHSIRLLDGRSINPRPGGVLSPADYVNRIRAGFFSVVILDFGPSAALDRSIVHALESNYHYHLAAEVPYGPRGAVVWQYQPQQRFRSDISGPRGPVVAPIRGLLTPVARPGPVLGPIVLAVLITGACTAVLTVPIRYAWRRGRASDDL